MPDDTEKPKEDLSFFEEIEVAGSQLVEKVKGIVKEGNVRQVKLSAQEGDFSLSMPMTVGVIAGGAITLAAPWLAILGTIAAVVSKVKLEVERDPNATPVTPDSLAEPSKVTRPATTDGTS